MKRKITCKVGDKVQDHDGRIGSVIELKPIMDKDGFKFPNLHRVVVQFIDGSTTEGIAEDFQTLTHQPPEM